MKRHTLVSWVGGGQGQGSGVILGSARLAGSGGMVWITTGSPEVGSTQPLISPTWLCPPGLGVEAGPHHTLSFLSASGTPALGPWVPPRIHFSAQRRVRAQPSPTPCAVRSPVSVGARLPGVRCQVLNGRFAWPGHEKDLEMEADSPKKAGCRAFGW